MNCKIYIYTIEEREKNNLLFHSITIKFYFKFIVERRIHHYLTSSSFSMLKKFAIKIPIIKKNFHAF